MSGPLFKINKNVEKVSKSTKSSRRQAERWSNTWVKSMDKVAAKSGKLLAAFTALAMAAVITIGFQGLEELDTVGAKVKSIAGSALDGSEIRSGLLKASTDTGISVNELGETQYSAISSGVSPEESLQASTTAAKLAKAGFTDANSALKIMTSTMNVYGLKGQEAMSAISDKLLVTQNRGVTTVAELAESMGQLTPIAKSAGATVDELMAGMASLTKNGLKTEEATTAYKAILTSVIKPTDDAAKAAKQLGIDFSVQAIKSKGLASFLEDVKEKTKGNTETMGRLFPNVRALSGALVLAGDGQKEFVDSLEAMKESQGTTAEAYAVMTDTIGFKVEKLKNRVKNTFTAIVSSQSGTIGELLDGLETWLSTNEDKISAWVEAIGQGIKKAIEFAKRIQEWIIKNQDLILGVVSFITTLYTVIKVFGAVKAALGAINTIWLILNGTIALTPIGWIIIGITALITVAILVWKNWDKINQKWSEFAEKYPTLHKIVTIIGKVLKDILIATLQKLWEIIQSVGIIAAETFFGILDTFENVGKNLLEFLENVFTGQWEKAFENIYNIFFSIFENIWKTAERIWEKITGLFDKNKEVNFNVETNVNQRPQPNVPYDAPVRPPVPVTRYVPAETPVTTPQTKLREYAFGGIAKEPSIFGDAGWEMAIPLKKDSPRSLSLLAAANEFFGNDKTKNVEISTTQNVQTNKSEQQVVYKLVFQGPVYGFDDFAEKVMEALVKARKVVGPNVVGG